MTVHKEASGKRSVSIEVELPGTPEQIWQAIATGPGITSWFVPAEIEERTGGGVTFHVLPEFTTSGVVTAWEPPGRFAYEERDWMPGAPPLATECFIETRDGGTCVLRLVHSLFASGDDWDDQLESFLGGWPPAFRVLRLYLRHFAGRAAASSRVMIQVSLPGEEAFHTLLARAGLTGAKVGERCGTRGSGVPALEGLVELAQDEHPPRELIVRVDRPAPGIAAFGIHEWGGDVRALLSFYWFGADAETWAKKQDELWSEWLHRQLPASEETGA